ncbi:MAG: M28 family peptidase [Myxococcota bacterium]
MPRRLRRPRALVWTLALALPACGACVGGSSPVDDAAEPAAPVEEMPADFQASAAWAELEMLAALGPRTPGSDAAEAARRRIRDYLERYGVPVETVDTVATPDGLPPVALTHVLARLPGTSADRFVLVAPYDSGRHEGFDFVGTNDGASGTAVLLEVARVLARREFPYTVEIVFLDGEGRLGQGEGDVANSRWWGSRTLAETWQQGGRLDDVRLLVSVNRVCDAELAIARDLGSHRNYREEFWRAARRLGETESFVPHAGYESFTSSHAAFRERGLRAVVGLADTAFGGAEAPGVYAGTADDLPMHCAEESLASVGAVIVDALDTIAARLAKIDRFSVRPEPTRPSTETAAAAESGDDAPADADTSNADSAETPAAEATPTS